MIQKIETPFFKACVNRYGWHLSIKSALEARGLMGRTDRMPLLALGEEDHRVVVDVLNSLPIDEMAHGGR
jgi:hypothetical protein